MSVVLMLVRAPPRVRRAVAVGLAVAFLAICIMGVAFLANLLATARADNEELRRQIVTLEGALQRVRQNPRADAAQGGEGLKLPGETSAAKAAVLQSWISDSCRERGVKIQSFTSQPDWLISGARLIGLRADVSGPYEAVVGWIRDVEARQPPLLARSVELRPASPRPGGETTAQIVIYGLADFSEEPSAKARRP